MPSTGMPCASLSRISVSSDARRQIERAAPDLRGEQQLPARRGPQPFDRFDGALVRDREGTDLLDLVAPELHPGRMLVGGREDVQDAATDRELAALGDQVHPCVRHVGKPTCHVLELGLAAGDQLDRLEVAEPLELRLQNRPHRRHHDAELAAVRVGEAAQHSQPPADRVGPRRQPLVRQRLPGRVHRDPVRLIRQPSASARSSASRLVAVTARTGRAAPAASTGAATAATTNGRSAAGAVRSSASESAPPLRARSRSAGQPPVAQGGRDQTGELHG
jgi:hypothetical protein